MTEYSIPDFVEYLKDYLKINYPEKAGDDSFIEIRNSLAKASYLQSRAENKDHDLAMEKAMDVLLKDYQFSKFDIISNILYDRYSALFSRTMLNKFTRRFMPACERVFQEYVICDDLLFGEQFNILHCKLSVILEKQMNDYWGFEV